MSSGFVSGGTSDQPRERNELWQKAEQELEAARQRKFQEGKNHEGRSLYEVLQENKGSITAAKQEAFEESVKLKHQFRSLDEDDVSFLNSIRDSATAKERAVQEETLSRLDSFRKQQQKHVQQPDTADDDASASKTGLESPEQTLVWQTAAKKRKREPVKGLKGVKIARTVAVEPADNTASSEQTSVAKPAHDLEQERSHGATDNDSAIKSTQNSDQKPALIPDQESAVKCTGVPGKESSKEHNSSSALTMASRGKAVAPTTETGLGLFGYGSDDSDDD